MVVVRTVCMTRMFLRIRPRAHRIGVTEHLGVRLAASPSPQALDDKELFVIEGSKNGHSRPDGRSAKNAAKCSSRPSSDVPEESVQISVCERLREHEDTFPWKWREICSKASDDLTIVVQLPVEIE